MTVADDRRFIMTDGASEMKYDRCPNNWFGVHDYQPRYDGMSISRAKN